MVRMVQILDHEKHHCLGNMRQPACDGFCGRNNELRHLFTDHIFTEHLQCSHHVGTGDTMVNKIQTLPQRSLKNWKSLMNQGSYKVFCAMYVYVYVHALYVYVMCVRVMGWPGEIRNGGS